jgi:hypothetical protein
MLRQQLQAKEGEYNSLARGYDALVSEHAELKVSHDSYARGFDNKEMEIVGPTEELKEKETLSSHCQSLIRDWRETIARTSNRNLELLKKQEQQAHEVMHSVSAMCESQERSPTPKETSNYSMTGCTTFKEHTRMIYSLC